MINKNEQSQQKIKIENPTNPPSLPLLFLSFFKLGITSFGGPAMIAYVRKMAVEDKKWVSEESFRNGVALCQTIPGAIAMQSSAYVGLKTRGIAGALVSFTGFALPAFFFMMLLSAIYKVTFTMPDVITAFSGLQIIVVAIIGNATISLGKNYIKNREGVIIAISAAIMYGTGLNPVYVIISTALMGLIFYKKTKEDTKISTSENVRSTRDFLLVLFSVFIFFLTLFFFSPPLFNLAILLSRIDFLSFGGAFASIPIILHEIVTVRGWMDETTFLNGIALGQVTPGPIVITATFIGYILYGPIGGIVATISIFAPSFLLVTGLEPYYDKFRSSPYFTKAINGILCSFTGLLLMTTFRFAVNVSWSVPKVLLIIGAFISLLCKVEPLWVILGGTVISIVASKVIVF